MPTKVVDVAPHDIHTDSASGHVADGFRRGEAGLEDQIVDLVVGEFGVGRHEAALPRPVENAGLVESGAVVLDLDDDAAALVVGVELYRPGRVLARGTSYRRRLEPVVEGVAHQMDERVRYLLEHRLVELGALARQAQFHLLAELP